MTLKRAVILLILGSLILCAGCGGDYYAEKTYWHLNMKHGQTIRAPGDATEKEFMETISALKKVVSKYPAWGKSAEIQFQIGQTYVSRKDFSNARKELMEVVMNFPNTIESLQVPLMIAIYYHSNNRPDEANNAFRDAIAGYSNIIQKNPGKRIAVIAQEFIANAYAMQYKWDDALRALNLLVLKYPNDPQAATALFEAAQIYEEKLEEPSKAYDLYAKLAKNYPNHKHGFIARTKISKKNAIESK